MQSSDDLSAVEAIMMAFAQDTGLRDPHKPPRRYLWTDAHAVCTFLGLYRSTGDDSYRQLAEVLVDQVHEVLGRHRDDDPREGWISGLNDDDGRAHPTAGGLRIGKQLNERGRSESIDQRLEWDRDGQYFHYLTKWMHALCRVGALTGDDRYNRWAAELAKAAFSGFVVAVPGGERLQWKMSIDLSYSLVDSSGHHDPLDGFVTYHEISHTGADGLDEELGRLAGMMAGRDWATTDPLGIGGLLFDACRAFQLTAAGELASAALARTLVAAARDSLGWYSKQSDLALPAANRLAFRELGLSIGLHGIETMIRVADRNNEIFGAELRRELDSLRRFAPLSAVIEEFWRQTDSQQARSWREHADINAVTLATSLLPEDYLAL